MKLINNILAAAILLPLFTLASCNNDDPDPLIIYNAFVNYQGTEGNTATFTTQEKDDSELITFTTTANVSSLTKGNRYVISYSTPDGSRFKSGPIELYQWLTPYQEPYKEATIEEIQELNTNPVSCSPGRTGVYINVPAVAEFPPKTFGLYVDKATMSNELPDVYVIFKADDKKPSQAGTYLGSFDISKLFENHAGIRLHYQQNGIYKMTDYRKGNMTIKPVE